jgi:hypothetical protein
MDNSKKLIWLFSIFKRTKGVKNEGRSPGIDGDLARFPHGKIRPKMTENDLLVGSNG